MRKNLIVHKNLAIIGGGPVGLTTARLLQMKGATVTVYERDLNANSRITGGTLDLHKGTGQKAMEQAGLLEAFRKHARPTGMKVADMQGKIVFEMKPDRSKPEIDRPDLRKILLESVKQNTVVWDRQVIAVDQKGDVFELQFQNGEKAEADFVIIADGGMSKARKYITDTLPEETGTYVIQGEIANMKVNCPNIWKMVNDNNMAIVEDKKALFFQNRGDGSICFYVSFRKNEQWIKDTNFDFNNIPAVNEFLHKLFKNWNPVYNELFAACKEYMGFPLRIFHASEKLKPHTNITLVGDAAHLMVPFGGMGVNMGLVDAMTLTENLTNGKFSTLQAAVDDYEQKMFAYALPLQRETHEGDDRIHTQTEHSAKNFKRKLMMRILKGVQFVALFFLLLVTGVFWGNYFSLTRSMEVFSAPELIHLAKTLVQNLGIPMRIISPVCLLFMGLSAWLQPQKKSKEFYFTLAAIICIFSALMITVLIEVPINNQIINWTEATLPADWEAIRNRWQFFNVIRTTAALIGFGFFTIAIVKPFSK